MPTPLTGQQMVLMQEDTDYTDMNIPVGSSVVINWNGASILIFNSSVLGLVPTDISDLGPAVISQLSNIGSTTPTVWGAITALPQSVSQTISSEADTAIEAAKSTGAAAAAVLQAAADAIGKAAAAATGPVVDSLLPILAVAAGFLIFFYLPKRGK